MDKHRKYAYRYLLYWMTIEVRPLAWPPSGRDWFNPFFWRRYIRRVRAMGTLAQWLHNMASFSAREFKGFDEEQFWEEFEHCSSLVPALEYYRSLFENALTESQTGRWPSIEEQEERDA